MKPPFYHSFTLVSPNSPQVLRDRLSRHVQAPQPMRLSWGFGSTSRAAYEGEIWDTGFKVSRIIDYRNSFLPVIRGRFEPTPQGTQVHFTLAIHPAVGAFLVAWLGLWYGMTIPLMIFQLSTLINRGQGLLGLLFLGMPLVALTAFGFAFWAEARHSQRELSQILQRG
jgi:hypothetical protein